MCNFYLKTFSRPCINAVLAHVIAMNLMSAFINLNSPGYTPGVEWSIMLLAIGVICRFLMISSYLCLILCAFPLDIPGFVTYLAVVSPQAWETTQTVVFLLKALILLILFICGIVYVSRFSKGYL